MQVKKESAEINWRGGAIKGYRELIGALGIVKLAGKRRRDRPAGGFSRARVFALSAANTKEENHPPNVERSRFPGGMSGYLAL